MKPKLMGGATSILGCIALLMAGLHLIADPLASAQTPQATTAFASAPTAPIDTAKQQIRPAFEVASVRPADPNAEGRGWGMKLTRAGRLTTSGMSLTSLVWLAYAGESAKPGMGQQVKGGPKWADSEQFDISAKVDDTVAASWVKLTDKERMQRVRPMMRTLLEDRFQLKLHTETQMKDTYAVIQAKGGAKLKEVAPPPDIPDGDDPSTPGRGDKKASDKPPPGTFQISGNGLWKGSAIKVGVLISEIQGNCDLGDIVVDETGLKGYYDFTFTQTNGTDAPALIDQIQQQLGLKVVRRKEPVITYVIDSAEKPGEN